MGQETPVATLEKPADTPTATPSATPTNPGPDPIEEGRMAPSTASDPDDPIQQAMAARAQADLAQRLGTRTSEIRVVEVTAVEWHDASLGCPEPGMAYTQVITPGFRVVLEAEGNRYEYHTDEEQRTVCCDSAGTPPFRGVKSAETVRIAMEDLARRLGTPVADIDLVAVLGQEFPADVFYCRATKAKVARDESSVVIPGESILLSAAGKRYEYHATDQAVIFCRKLQSGRGRSSGWP
jgi:hypothetical protein